MKIDYTPEKQEAVMKLIHDFIVKHKPLDGDSVFENDNTNIESPILVGEIVDVLKPEYDDSDWD